MLFNTQAFVLGFLPVALGLFYAARSHAGRQAVLVGASLAFYGFWDVRFVPALVGLTLANWLVVRWWAAYRRRGILGLGIALNLGVLGVCKYADFLGANVAAVLGMPFTPFGIILPLGVSFFTFQKISYLVDLRRGDRHVYGLLDFFAFVTFFPQLIAGPLVRHNEIIPQFARDPHGPAMWENLSRGLALFTIGCAKKSGLADSLAPLPDALFAQAAAGPLNLAEGWAAAGGYALQIYLDFSGYSDMAIGLARMFNIRFPLNFNSPYKSASIIEYWQRWHMTLTRYLTLYLYNPIALSATRRRVARGLPITRKAYATPSGFMSMVAIPTFVTMGLAGVWHGAGVQFVVFGLLHATYLIVNHASRILRPGKGKLPDGLLRHAGKVALTYLAVLVAAVFFRAPSCGAALDLLAGMAGLHGNGPGMDLPLLPDGAARSLLTALGIVAAPGGASVPSGATVLRAGWIVMLYAVIWLGPNTQQIMRHYSPALERVQPWFLDWPAVRLNPAWAVTLGIGLMLGILATSGTAEFLYFQF